MCHQLRTAATDGDTQGSCRFNAVMGDTALECMAREGLHKGVTLEQRIMGIEL